MDARRIAVGLLSAIVLAVGLVVGLWFVAQAIDNRDAKGITVSGSAQLPAVADSAAWTLDSTRQAPSVAEATKGVLADQAELTKYLLAGGLTEQQVSVGGVTTSAVEGPDGPTGQYQAAASIRVRSPDVQLVAKLNRGIGTLLSQSTNMVVTNNAPEYFISNLAELRPKVQQEAVKDASNRAQIMVQAVGGTLGEPLAITTGSVQVIMQDSVGDEYGAYDLTTIDKTVRAVVTVTFSVK